MIRKFRGLNSYKVKTIQRIILKAFRAGPSGFHSIYPPEARRVRTSSGVAFSAQW